MVKNYYEILEVNRNASIEVIEQSFGILTKEYSPDSGKYNLEFANERMKEINESYDILRNASKRDEYNRIYDELLNKNSEKYTAKNENHHSYAEKLNHIYKKLNFNYLVIYLLLLCSISLQVYLLYQNKQLENRNNELTKVVNTHFSYTTDRLYKLDQDISDVRVNLQMHKLGW
ncbi:MAG: J domain-containing protein [Clostridiaceae bacterium]